MDFTFYLTQSLSYTNTGPGILRMLPEKPVRGIYYNSLPPNSHNGFIWATPPGIPFTTDWPSTIIVYLEIISTTSFFINSTITLKRLSEDGTIMQSSTAQSVDLTTTGLLGETFRSLGWTDVKKTDRLLMQLYTYNSSSKSRVIEISTGEENIYISQVYGLERTINRNRVILS